MALMKKLSMQNEPIDDEEQIVEEEEEEEEEVEEEEEEEEEVGWWSNRKIEYKIHISVFSERSKKTKSFADSTENRK